jgi:asparagine synthase (glutamine-hydrolysing)
LASPLIDGDFGRLLDAQVASAADVHPVTHAAFREIPWHLFGTLAAGRSQLTFRTPYLDNDIVALAFRAPAPSRQSPRAALRLIDASNPALGRIPTDRGLVWRSPEPFGKMRRLFCEATFKLDYLDKVGLPHWMSPFDPLIGSLSKLGLLGLHQYLPYRGWFRRELAGYVRDVLTDAQTQRMPYWNSRFLPTIVTDHMAGRRNYMREIGLILTLEAVDRTLIRGTAHPAGAHSVI